MGRLRVGISGSLASGKSTVLKVFHKAGFQAISADDLVHEIYDEKGLTREKILKRFPATAAGFKKLEAWIHPLVMKKIRSALARGPVHQPIAVEIPLLFELGLQNEFDCTVFVFSPKAHRRHRAWKRGMSLKLFNFLDAKQWKPQKKTRLADFVLQNSGDKKKLKAAAKQLVIDLCSSSS